MKTKPYTKNKKTIKKPDLAEGQWTPGEYKDEMQLDRIERKLDELLSRPPVQILPPSPGTWNVPEPPNPVYEKAPWWMNPEVPQPTITCSAERSAR